MCDPRDVVGCSLLLAVDAAFCPSDTVGAATKLQKEFMGERVEACENG